MAVAALVVAIVSALGSVYAVWYARRQAVAAERSVAVAARSAITAEQAARLETARRNSELTPRFRVTIEEANPGFAGSADLRMSVFLAGPFELRRLDWLVVRIRDDYPGRAEGSRIAGGPSPEEVAAQVWGPYRFQPGTGPRGGQLTDESGRATGPAASY